MDVYQYVRALLIQSDSLNQVLYCLYANLNTTLCAKRPHS